MGLENKINNLPGRKYREIEIFKEIESAGVKQLTVVLDKDDLESLHTPPTFPVNAITFGRKDDEVIVLLNILAVTNQQTTANDVNIDFAFTSVESDDSIGLVNAGFMATSSDPGFNNRPWVSVYPSGSVSRNFSSAFGIKALGDLGTITTGTELYVTYYYQLLPIPEFSGPEPNPVPK
jgi:hypothetical protein